jgi:hypothetical protein
MPKNLKRGKTVSLTAFNSGEGSDSLARFEDERQPEGTVDPTEFDIALGGSKRGRGGKSSKGGRGKGRGDGGGGGGGRGRDARDHSDHTDNRDHHDDRHENADRAETWAERRGDVAVGRAGLDYDKKQATPLSMGHHHRK